MGILATLTGGNRIPKHWEDVTPQWMTRSIRSRLPNAVVDRVELVMKDDGTNRRARFALTYSEGEGPASVFVKAHAAAHRIAHLRNGNLFGEARLFRSGVDLPVDHPLVYRSETDRLRLDFLLVMEDLKARGADPRDASRPMTIAQVADGLAGLARLHGHYWEFSDRRLRWVRTWAPGQGWQIGLRRCVPRGLERAAGQLPQAILDLDGDAIVDLWVRYVATLSREPMTLVHGDAHIGNTYILAGDTVGFLDWQTVRRGAWHQDMGYFLVSSLTEADRRRGEQALVDSYLAALKVPGGKSPSREEAWLRYRASMVYGLTIWLSTLGTTGYQPHPISLALAQRFAAACVELDSFAALQELERMLPG